MTSVKEDASVSGHCVISSVTGWHLQPAVHQSELHSRSRCCHSCQSAWFATETAACGLPIPAYRVMCHPALSILSSPQNLALTLTLTGWVPSQMWLSIGLRVFTPVQTARINVRVYPALNMDIFAFLKCALKAQPRLTLLYPIATHPAVTLIIRLFINRPCPAQRSCESCENTAHDMKSALFASQDSFLTSSFEHQHHHCTLTGRSYHPV